MLLPRRRRRLFVVRGMAVRRLPFGWSFSPAVFKELTQRLVRNCLRGCGVRAWVYLDDILIASMSSSKLQRARDRVLCKLTRAGFLVSDKSELTPHRSLTWVGKEVCREGRCISNSAASIAQCISFLLRGLLMGRLLWERLRSLLGRLQWVARPRCTLEPFLSGAYRGVGGRSLQAAELWAATSAITVAVNRGERRLWLGLDSKGARHILGRGTLAGHCVTQQRILRRLFWLRGWSGVQANIFRVPSADNLPNLPSQLPSLASRTVAIATCRVCPPCRPFPGLCCSEAAQFWGPPHLACFMSCVYVCLLCIGRPENCFAGGGWHWRPAKEGGGGVPEMGFRAGPFVLCKDGCCHQRRRNTNFGPEKLFSRKNFPPHMCSQNDQRDVGIILSHVCRGQTPPPQARQVGQPQPKPPSRHGDQGGGGGGWANGLPCHPSPRKAIFFPPCSSLLSYLRVAALQAAGWTVLCPSAQSEKP